MAAGEPESASIVCLGEALVDLIGEPPGEDPLRFEVHFGGALANVAVAVVRHGAPAALAGGLGDDGFGRLLRGRLREEGVAMTHLTALQQMATPFAFVRTEPSGDPIFELHGAGIEAGVASLSGSERELLEGAVALVVGSNTLTTKPAATVTCKTVEEADRAGVPVLFDPNLRPGRWGRIETALERCRALAASATVIKANLEEARLLGATDSSDPTALAAGLLGLGPRLAVVTVGAAGAVARLAGEDAAYR
ncbi:MAG: hypothetical protein JJE23_14160, partial [Thermoleophilia bacterium]|nr:hypothetical protein [Thermoleophilia bacterium]